MDRKRTLKEVANYLSPGCTKEGEWNRIVRFPPDLFAIVATILKESGAYRLVVERSQERPWANSEAWRVRCRKSARSWAIWAVREEAYAALREDLDPILTAAKAVKSHLDLEIAELPDRWEIVNHLLFLMAAADETFYFARYLRRRRRPTEEREDRDLILYCFSMLVRQAERNSYSTFSNDRVQILPKLRTPSNGLTIRSLSRYLTLDLSEIDSRWFEVPYLDEGSPRDGDRFNILLLPWPRSIVPQDFSVTETPGNTFGFFSFVAGETNCQESNSAKLGECFDRIVERAKALVGSVDAVVLPETATNYIGFRELLARCGKPGFPSILICGSSKSEDDTSGSYAYLGIVTGTGSVIFEQAKQHRWSVDDRQIRQYHLGAVLHPGVKWWEEVPAQERTLHFVRTRKGLTLCPLICEDLARIEPAGELIRGVAPNLVVGLLLDGPQIESRWPARYATVLAEDPGSAVLTLTPLGMCERCWDDKHPPSRSIALWKDPQRGLMEVRLPGDAVAAVLSTSVLLRTGRVADGRVDEGSTHELVLSGIEFVDRGHCEDLGEGIRNAARAAREKREREEEAVPHRGRAEASGGAPRQVKSGETDLLPPEGMAKLAVLCEALVTQDREWWPAFFAEVRESERRAAELVGEEASSASWLEPHLRVLEEVIASHAGLEVDILAKILRAPEKRDRQRVEKKRCGDALRWAMWSTGSAR